VFTARITRSVPLYSCQASWKADISAWQGGHQLAQKFRMMGRPLSSDSMNSEPSREDSVKSGAKNPSLGASVAEEGSADGGRRENHIQASRTRGIDNKDKELFIFM